MLFNCIPIIAILYLLSSMAKMAIWSFMAIFGCYGTYGHGQWDQQHGHYGYAVKKHWKTNSTVLVSALSDNPFKNYSSFNFFWTNVHSKNGRFEPEVPTLEIMGLQWKEKQFWTCQNGSIAKLLCESYWNKNNPTMLHHVFADGSDLGYICHVFADRFYFIKLQW